MSKVRDIDELPPYDFLKENPMEAIGFTDAQGEAILKGLVSLVGSSQSLPHAVQLLENKVVGSPRTLRMMMLFLIKFMCLQAASYTTRDKRAMAELKDHFDKLMPGNSVPAEVLDSIAEVIEKTGADPKDFRPISVPGKGIVLSNAPEHMVHAAMMSEKKSDKDDFDFGSLLKDIAESQKAMKSDGKAPSGEDLSEALPRREVKHAQAEKRPPVEDAPEDTEAPSEEES